MEGRRRHVLHIQRPLRRQAPRTMRREEEARRARTIEGRPTTRASHAAIMPVVAALAAERAAEEGRNTAEARMARAPGGTRGAVSRRQGRRATRQVRQDTDRATAARGRAASASGARGIRARRRRGEATRTREMSSTSGRVGVVDRIRSGRRRIVECVKCEVPMTTLQCTSKTITSGSTTSRAF